MVGTISISCDDDLDRLVVVVEESVRSEDEREEDLGAADDDEDEGDGVARILLTRERATAFAIRATSLVEAGRPACPLSGLRSTPRATTAPGPTATDLPSRDRSRRRPRSPWPRRARSRRA